MQTSSALGKASGSVAQARGATWPTKMRRRIGILPAAIALAVGLLIGAGGTGAAAGTIQAPASATMSQPAGGGQADPQAAAAPAAPDSPMLPPAGTVGFGWG
jgi:hypothetical protein